ncbi:MAG: hypothetical protein HGA45_34900 [Chloroflexales bacterium]|nr:hypothetical protein [Chloroflexales bacterium]
MRRLYLQDDTHLPLLGSWRRTDGSDCLLAELAVVAALERHFGLDRSPLHEVADDHDGPAVQAIRPYLFGAGTTLEAIPADLLCARARECPAACGGW